jgi:hypothetical protein
LPLSASERGLIEQMIDLIIAKIPNITRIARDTDYHKTLGVSNDIDYLMGYLMGYVSSVIFATFFTEGRRYFSDDLTDEIGKVIQRRASEIKSTIPKEGEE